MIDWQWCRLEELTAQQQYAVFAARQAVFIVEQACIYEDMDGLDLDALHLTGWSGGTVAAYLRMLAPGVKYREPSLGRVLTTREFRGSGLGRQLMAIALAHVERLYPNQGVRISAQTYLDAFYRGFGFESCSATYLDAGISHVEMLRR